MGSYLRIQQCELRDGSCPPGAQGSSHPGREDFIQHPARGGGGRRSTRAWHGQPLQRFPGMDYLPFLLALLHVHKALCGEILWDTTVEWNENLTLECAHSPTKLLTQLVWLKHSGQKKDRIATFNPTMGLEITKPYANRVSIKNSTAASNVLILSFKKASEADLGFYTCHFYTFPDGGMEKIIQVVTTDNFESLASLNETIPELASGTGQNITLTYQFQMKGPVKRVTWEKIQPHQTDVLTSCNLLEERSYTANYQLQAWANCRNGSRASLLFIPSLTASEAAIYRCLVEGSAGERETYWVRLTVHQPQNETSYQQKFLVVGVGGGILLLAAVLIIVICIIFYYRRRKYTNAPFKGYPDTENKSANNSRTPVSHSQATDRAQDDIYVNYPTTPQKTESKV